MLFSKTDVAVTKPASDKLALLTLHPASTGQLQVNQGQAKTACILGSASAVVDVKATLAMP